MAETVQDSMTRSLSLVNRGVKQAGFYVLGGAAAGHPDRDRLSHQSQGREEARHARLPRVGGAGHLRGTSSEYKRRYDQRLPARPLFP